MRIGDQTEARAFGATWRDEVTGEIVGTAFGGTVCWFPRKPWTLKLGDPDWEFPPRCRECPGCLELDRRYLADRLKAKYPPTGKQKAKCTHGVKVSKCASCQIDQSPLFAVRIQAHTYFQASLSRKLHRRPALELEPGFWRMGTASFAVLTRNPKGTVAALKLRGIEAKAYKINLSRGRRAWQPLTAGISVTREAYGENLNRFYARGLPKREKLTWKVNKSAMQKPWRRATGPRVRTGRGVVLVPPELWKMPRTIRRELRALMAAATTPEETKQALQVIADAFGGRSQQLNSNPQRGALLTREQVAESYRLRDERKAALRSSLPEGSSNTLSFPERGYVTSIHSRGSPTPQNYSDAELLELGPSGKPKWIEREHADDVNRSASKVKRNEDFKAMLETWPQKMVRLAREWQEKQARAKEK